MRRSFTWLFLLFLLICIRDSAHAWPLAPREDFLTMHTENFRVTYPREHRFAALKAAVIAEEVFPLLCRRLKWTPHTPIDIIITDRTDEANGYNSNSPIQIVHLFLAPPHSEDRLDYYDDWWRMLITHELTHAVHIDAVRALPAVARHVFGRVYPVGHAQPISIIEGMAVHEETDLTTRGRARSPVSMMLLRMAALEDRWPTIDRISSYSTDWPGQAGPYIWGGVFFQYLADRFGEAALAYYNRKHSGQIWPYLFNYNAKKIFGASLVDLYKQWSAKLKAGFAIQETELITAGLSEQVQLTHSGFNHTRPRWLSPHEIIYEERTGFRTPQLRQIDIRHKKRKGTRVLSTHSTKGLTVAPDGVIYYADAEPWDRWRSYYDLWRYRPGDWRPKRLTTLARIHEPALIPGTRQALAVAQSGGRTQLTRVDLDTGDLTPLTAFRDPDLYVQFAGPAVHPGGKWAVVSVWHDDGDRDLFSFDLQNKTFTRLTAHPERDIDPAFDPTGNTLYFSSARSDIHNIYALDLQSNELFQVTNVLGGAFMPAVDPTGNRLAFIGYNAGGYDLYWLPLNRERWRKVEREPIAGEGFVAGPISQQIHQRARNLDPYTDRYSAWRTIYPHWWLPDYAIGTENISLGARTGGTDALHYHYWSLASLYNFDQEFVAARADYAYSGLTPILRFNLQRRLENHGKVIDDEDGDPIRYWEQRVAGNAVMLWPFLARHQFALAYRGEYRSDWTDVPPGNEEIPFTGFWSALRTGWFYSSLRSYLQTVTSAEGTSLSAMATFYDPAFGSEVRQQLLTGQMSRFFSLPLRNHVLAFQFAGGVSHGRQLAQRNFRLGGFRTTNLYDGITDDDRFVLRGYDAGFRGGDAVATGSAEWYFPLWRVNRGISTWPVFLQGINASPFFDAGFAVNRKHRLETDDIYHSVGTELYLDTVLSYYYSVRFRTAFAYGLRDTDDTGGFHWFLTLGGLL